MEAFIAPLLEWMTQFRVEIFAAGILLVFALLINASRQVISIPGGGRWQTAAAGVLLIAVSFIWLFTDGGWEAIFDKISSMTIGLVVGGTLVYRAVTNG